MSEQGFTRLVVVVGYLEDHIRQYLERNAEGLSVHFVFNSRYSTTNNIYSLWLASQAIDEDFLLIESDLVFDTDLLNEMVVPDRIAVARLQPFMHGTTVTLDAMGIVAAFHLGPDSHLQNTPYKTVNIYSLSSQTWRDVLQRLNERISNGLLNDYYEVVFAEMIAEQALNFQAVHFDAGRWYEIDTIADLHEAERVFHESPLPVAQLVPAALSMRG